MRGIVAIVGRPNVGKSTLFNRLIEQRLAIVDDQPGVTRDRNYGTCHWAGREFSVVDTGGYIPESADVFAAAIREQVEIALEQADVVVFVVDTVDGLLPIDAEVLDVIRRRGKDKVVLVANKADNAMRTYTSAEFLALGLGEVYPISALSGAGTGELLDRILELLPADVEPEYTADVPRLAIVGRPNVGKSSLVNALVGQTVQIVTPLAGTTRDAQAVRYQAFGFDYYLVDTAGLRRKAKVNDNVEYYSAIRTLRALEECDIALLLFDATTGLEAQDLAILRQVEKHRKGLVLLANKWDLVDKNQKGADTNLQQHVAERIAPMKHVPLVLISATEKLRLHKTMEIVRQMVAEQRQVIPTRQLNDYLLPILAATPPPSTRGKLIRIKFVSQVDGRVPTILLFTNYPKLIPESYKRFVEAQVRARYPFTGWPMNLFFREK
ncbi:MAG: ribosome biogenesis GTPase Der [Bacteroidia bacterium]|nr:ribosome biogenesis GTPase Der [Bacteroidia bacterium]